LAHISEHGLPTAKIMTERQAEEIELRWAVDQAEWEEKLFAAGAAGATSVVDHYASMADERLEYAYKRLEANWKEKVTWWLPEPVCADSFFRPGENSGRKWKPGMRLWESGTPAWTNIYVFLFRRFLF